MLVHYLDKEIEADQIKFARLSSGVSLGFFQIVDPRSQYTWMYLVLVKRGREVLHHFRFHQCANAACCFIEFLCRYA